MSPQSNSVSSDYPANQGTIGFDYLPALSILCQGYLAAVSQTEPGDERRQHVCQPTWWSAIVDEAGFAQLRREWGKETAGWESVAALLDRIREQQPIDSVETVAAAYRAIADRLSA